MAIKREHPASGAIRKRLDPSERRAQLLEHAISAFADAGIERAVHADVASRAQVSTPTVFKYFPTRDALVDAVLSEIENTLVDMRDYLPEGAVLSSPELVRALSAVLSHLCIERPDLMKVALTWSVAFSPIKPRYLAFETKLLQNLSFVMDAKLTAETDTRILFASALLFVRMHFDGDTIEMRRHYVERMCEIMEAGSDRSAFS
jgi:TetR/AcrR family hemagglutinin/protease transcriptional regulator